MTSSIENFITYVSQIETYAKQIWLKQHTIDIFTSNARDARRIYITGTGTSLPTALYLTTELIRLFDFKPVTFLPTAKMIRQIPQLREDDLVIIISHGFNRADGLIIHAGASMHCKTVLITGRTVVELNDQTLLVTVPPVVEKVFCRPISPITTLLVIRQLMGYGVPADLPKLPKLNKIVDWIDTKKQIILLYSADVSFAAELWGIVLREGAGLNVLTKDVESYAHGYYGTDTANLHDRQFIILTSDSEMDTKDLGRSDGLYGIKAFDKYIVRAEGDMFMSNLMLFRSVPELVKEIILRTNYDMDQPNGMTENRKYHEYDRYKDYYPS